MKQNLLKLALGVSLAATLLLAAQAHADQPAAKPATKVCALSVDGMSCGGCAAGVNAALQKLDGVKKSEITFEKKGGPVEFDPAKVDEKKIVAAVEKAGFKATAKKEAPKQPAEKAQDK